MLTIGKRGFMHAEHTSSPFWWVELLIGILLLVVAHFTSKKILHAVQKKEKENPASWRAYIGHVIQPPITLVLWIIGIVYVVEVLGHRFSFLISISYVHAFKKSLIVGATAWLILRWFKEIQHSILAESSRKIDATTVQMIGKLLTILVLFLSGVAILQIFGFDTSPLLAIGTIGGAALGFGGKDIIANFGSGLMLQITRPFVLGDYIVLPEKSLEGNVEEIGWFRSSIRDKDKRSVYLPNSFFTTLLIINSSRISHRRMRHVFRLPFSVTEKIPTLTEKLRKMVMSYPSIDTTIPLQIYLYEVGETSFNLEIEILSKETNFDKFKRLQQEILLKAERILKEEDISFAVQQIQLVNTEPKF